VIFAFVATALPAYGQVRLEWRLKEGDTFSVEEVAKARHVFTTASGNKIPSGQTTAAVTRFTVVKRLGDKVVVEQKVESFNVTADTKLDADVERLAGRMKGTALTLTLDARGRVERLEGYEAFVKHLSEGKDEAARTVRQMFSKDNLIHDAELFFAFPPDRAVTKGDRWRQPAVFSVPPLGSFRGERELTYQGQEAGAERIAFKASLTFVPARGDGGAFKVLRGKFTSADAQGTILFDAGRGRVTEHTLTLTARGTLTVEVGGNPLTMQIDYRHSATARVLDRN
jgi:hypothetical protein